MTDEPLYVIGFPKSGTSWLTRLVCHALDGWLEQGNPGKPGDAARRNAELGLVQGRGPAVRQTHLLPLDLEDFAGDEARIGIYIYRDLRDVLISGFFFQHTIDYDDFLARGGSFSLGVACTAPLSTLKRQYWRGKSRRTLRDFVSRICLQGWKPFGGWSEHICQWRAYAAARPDRHMVFISYEALRADTVEVLGSSLEALGLEKPPYRKLAAVVARHSAEHLLRTTVRQESEGVSSLPYRDPIRGTLRKGTVGDYRRYMSRREAVLVERTHGPMLRELGYIENEAWIEQL